MFTHFSGYPFKDGVFVGCDGDDNSSGSQPAAGPNVIQVSGYVEHDLDTGLSHVVNTGPTPTVVYPNGQKVTGHSDPVASSTQPFRVHEFGPAQPLLVHEFGPPIPAASGVIINHVADEDIERYGCGSFGCPKLENVDLCADGLCDYKPTGGGGWFRWSSVAHAAFEGGNILFRYGVFDYEACTDNAKSCLLEIAMVTPGGRAFKGARALGKAAEAGADAAKAAKKAAPRTALDDLGGLSCRSFSSDTGVLMANGTTKPISDVEVGDLVSAKDPETGEVAPQRVLRTLPHVDRLLVFETSAGQIWTTEDHLYWNVTDSEWQQSQDLSAGDALLSATGALVTAVGLDWQTARVDLAYDLDVSGFDTFFVVVGEESALVHNIECPWKLKTDSNFGNQVLDGALPQTGQLSALTADQLIDLQMDLATSIRNRQRNLWDGTFATNTQQFQNHAARVDLEVGLLDRVEDLLGSQ